MRMYNDPMKTVYLVRHGESEWNASDYFEEPNAPLTDLGRIQANKAGKRLAASGATTIICSELVRAQQTADEIASFLQVPTTVSPLFNERVFPNTLLGYRKTDPVVEQVVDGWTRALDGRGEWNGLGDSFDVLRDRVDDAIEFLETHESDVLIVVSHAYFMRILLARALYGKTLTQDFLAPFVWAVREENASISNLVFNAEDTEHWSRWNLEYWADSSHLRAS